MGETARRRQNPEDSLDLVHRRPRGATRPGRGLHEEGNDRHRLRVEHDQRTLLIHLSGEDGVGWTTVAIDRRTRQWAVAQGTRQADTSKAAYERLDGLRSAAPDRSRK